MHKGGRTDGEMNKNKQTAGRGKSMRFQLTVHPESVEERKFPTAGVLAACKTC